MMFAGDSVSFLNNKKCRTDQVDLTAEGRQPKELESS